MNLASTLQPILDLGLFRIIIKKEPSPSVNPVTKLGFNKSWDVPQEIRVCDYKAAREENDALPSLRREMETGLPFCASRRAKLK